MVNVEPVSLANTVVGLPLKPNKQVFALPPNDALKGRSAWRDENGVWRNSLGFESSAKHRHVACEWQKRCIPFQEFWEQAERDDRAKKDEIQPLSYMSGFDDDLRFPDGAHPSPIALRQLLRIARLPASFATIGEVEGGAYTSQLAHILRGNLSAKLDSGANIYCRYRPDENGRRLLRAAFTGLNPPLLDNIETLEMIRSAFPEKFRNKSGWGDALASHLEDTIDDMRGNILFPDEMKHQPDSDYGVGLQFRNSEVEPGNLCIKPFLFRAICRNGCIWGRNEGLVHISLGKASAVDRVAIRKRVREVVQIALSEGNDLLTLMGYTYELPVPEPEKMIAYLAKRSNLTQEMCRTWYRGYITETVNEGAVFKKTAFGVVQGLTRAAQDWQGERRQQMETTASVLVAKSLRDDIDQVAKRWKTFNTEAESVQDEAVEQWVQAGSYRA